MTKGCETGKVTFETRKDARAFAAKRRWLNLRTYHCHLGDHWHNTSYSSWQMSWARSQ